MLKLIKKYKLRLTIVFIFIFLIVWSVYSLSNPLRKSEEDIRDMLLSNIPIGTHIDDVNAYIAKNKRWNINHEFRGYSDYETYGTGLDLSLGKGEKKIRVHMGRYRFIFETTVEAYLTFDSSGNLTEVRVEQHTDGL